MPRNLPHVKLNTHSQSEQPVVLHFNYSFGKDDNEAEPDPDYTFMAQSFGQDLSQFLTDVNLRRAERNPVLEVPAHIEYVEVLFQSQFALNKYFQQWRNAFGLEAVQVSDFGTKILFAIIDSSRMRDFITNVRSFIAKESGAIAHVEYSRLLLYIKSFKLLNTADILKIEEDAGVVNVQLMDLPLANQTRDEILAALRLYLGQRNLAYALDIQNANLEVFGASNDELLEIARNFDIAFQITSSLSTRIRPGKLNQPLRSYGFEVNGDADLPIVAVVDTGVSAETPLAPLIGADEELNLTGSPVTEDNADGGRGHGTAVAALTALGKRPYRQNYQGTINADARILPIKIMDSDSGYLSQKAVIQKLQLAKAKYPSLKIFVLATVYKQHKKYNDAYSTYAHALDMFAYENDCLICICSGNNSNAGLINTTYNLAYFGQEETNLCPPAESMNNLTIGAASDSLGVGHHVGLATGKEFPALYTRKGHIDYDKLLSPAKANKRLFKPDVIEAGGDYSITAGGMLSDIAGAAMEVLSADPAESFYRQIGTSFATPLVANIAAQIQRKYPDLKAASIKALIINSASCERISIEEKQRNNLAGCGLVDESRAVFSSENSVSMLLEENIDAEQVKIFPVRFPNYLIEGDLRKSRGVVRLTATLCFQFAPLLYHQQGYCPLHIAFGIFRNHTGDQIQLSEKTVRSALKSNAALWSQSARFKEKPNPMSNVQKITIPINRQELLDENNTFKLAVQCRVHPQLLPGQEGSYLYGNPFSIVLTLEEDLPEKRLTGKLYNGILQVNQTIAIEALTAQAEAAEAQAEN